MDEIYQVIQTLISEIAISGAVIILAGLVTGYIIKKWIPDEAMENKLIPTINTVLGLVLGLVIPGLFPNASIVVQAIYGATCGFLASIVYDKIVWPIKEKFTKKDPNNT